MSNSPDPKRPPWMDGHWWAGLLSKRADKIVCIDQGAVTNLWLGPIQKPQGSWHSSGKTVRGRWKRSSTMRNFDGAVRCGYKFFFFSPFCRCGVAVFFLCIFQVGTVHSFIPKFSLSFFPCFAKFIFPEPVNYRWRESQILMSHPFPASACCCRLPRISRRKRLFCSP